MQQHTKFHKPTLRLLRLCEKYAENQRNKKRAGKENQSAGKENLLNGKENDTEGLRKSLGWKRKAIARKRKRHRGSQKIVRLENLTTGLETKTTQRVSENRLAGKENSSLGNANRWTRKENSSHGQAIRWLCLSNLRRRQSVQSVTLADSWSSLSTPNDLKSHNSGGLKTHQPCDSHQATKDTNPIRSQLQAAPAQAQTKACNRERSHPTQLPRRPIGLHTN